MDTTIELRYAGVVIGRATAVGDTGGASLFLAIPDPLPVGTRVGLKIDERTVEGRVVRVAESTDLAKCGMTVEIVEPGAPAAAPRGPDSLSPATLPPPASPSVPSSSPSPPPADSSPPPVEASSPAPVDEIMGDVSGAQVIDLPGDGPPAGDESSGQPGGGGGGGGRRRRRKR